MIVILPPSKPVVAVMRVEETSVEKKVAIVPEGERSSDEETTPVAVIRKTVVELFCRSMKLPPKVLVVLIPI